MAGVRLLAVADCSGASKDAPWPIRTSESWVNWVRLFGEASALDVGLLLWSVANYGTGVTKRSADQALSRLCSPKNWTMAGGLAATDGALTIYPSCCAGLEAWSEWRDAASGKLWLGHDPSPWVERRGEELVVHADGGLRTAGAETESSSPSLRFSMSELAPMVDQARQDLIDFIQPLSTWLGQNGPQRAEKVLKSYRRAYQLEP